MNLYCKYCDKECKNDNSLRNHERLCKSNPDRQTVNIENARKKANEKHSCVFCNIKVSLSSLKKHENSCESNPKIIEERGKECPVCNKFFLSKSITCSYSCSNTYFREVRNKPKNYINYRTICFKYHKKECVVCKENKILSVHHMNQNHNDNRPENLVPLCPTHHQYIHSRYKMEIFPEIEEYVKQFKLSVA